MDKPVRSLPQPLELRGGRSSRGGSGGGKKGNWKDGCGVGGFLVICFTLPLVWLNEKKGVRIHKVIVEGKKSYIEADVNKPQQQDKYALVHMTGRTSTFEAIGD